MTPSKHEHHDYCLYMLLLYTGCNEEDLADQSVTANPIRCANRMFMNSSSFSDGVVCYNGTTASSTAVYICDNGYNLVGNEARVCQSDGKWNGSIPLCIPEESGMVG